MSMYPWHGTTGTNTHTHHQHHHNTANAAAGPRIDHTHTAPSSSPSSFQMPQLRWLPSMMSRSQQNTLPTISSNLRMGAQNSHHQPVSVVVEARPPPPDSSEGSESDRSDSAVRDGTGPDGLGDPDYAPSPGDLGAGGVPNGVSGVGGGAGVVGGVAGGSNGNGLVGGRVLVDEDLDGTAGGGDTPRKHGKRLTTKEEVSLFDICNRHAGEFGQRSNLCKWWKTVTEEFTRDQGHPYSWHSVRRKVEIVTKQRMKFLEEQREKGGTDADDLSNPRWRAAVDAWIPTWQRWEEAEARRIERRDSRARKSRKRKDRSLDMWDGNSDGWRPSSTPVVESRFQGQSQHAQPPPASAASPPVPAASAGAAAGATAIQNTVRLPPGFDSMFASQTPQPNRTTAAGGWSYPQASPSAHAPSALEGSMMTAVLETLGKLNKHLDAVSAEPRSSPLVSSLTTNGQIARDGAVDAASGSMSAAFISQLKDELRQEMQDEVRRELEKDRASLEEKLDSVQRTQEMILEMLRQEPS
ncbi:hypothetical protein CDV55_104158 [Aspergillus turcosus]|nr:hypothetical protein CDV55_104158 [Aspergillus turcosus]